MTTYPIIKNPQYIDLEKTKVRMTLVSENGTETNVELSVPKNRETGINPIWDRILTEFDERQMRIDRNNLELRLRRENEFRDKKRKAAIESEKMRILFDQKMKCFEYPFVKNATNEEKSAVRRSPDIATLYIVVTLLAQKYVTENEMSLLDLIDDIENQQESK